MSIIGSSTIWAAPSAASGLSLILAGADPDHGISESRQAGPPGSFALVPSRIFRKFADFQVGPSALSAYILPSFSSSSDTSR